MAMIWGGMRMRMRMVMGVSMRVIMAMVMGVTMRVSLIFIELECGS